MPGSSDLSGATELYREEQPFARTWVWIPVVIVVAVAWYFFFREMVWSPEGSRAPVGLWIMFIAVGVLTPALFFSMRLIVTLNRRTFLIRMWPLYRRTVPVADIVSVEAVTYRPILEFGGWGVRYSLKRRAWGYTVSGKEGVQLELANGKRILVGSKENTRLASVLEQAKASA
jgi:hypothetical protein